MPKTGTRNNSRKNPSSPLPNGPGYPRGTETLLVAEDNSAMLAVIRTTLEAYGYTVIEAVYGGSVVEQIRQNRDRIRLVLCEVMMPGMSGAEIERAVRAEAPEIPILFMSGYIGENEEKKNRSGESARTIFKPFSTAALLQKIRSMLDGKAGPLTM